MTDLEEKLNIEAKKEFGEEFVLSINNGRKPSKQCIEAAVKAQKHNGSWNKGLKLSDNHRKAISNGMSNHNIKVGLINIKACIEQYMNDEFNNTYRICRYLKTRYGATINIHNISKDSIKLYYDMICEDIKNL